MIAVLETFSKRDQVDTCTLFPIPDFADDLYATNNVRKWIPDHLMNVGTDRRARVLPDKEAARILAIYRDNYGFVLDDRSYRGGYTWHTFRAKPAPRPHDETFRKAMQYPEEFKGTHGKRWFDGELETAQGQREGTVVGLLGGGTVEAGDFREEQARRLFALDPVEFSDFVVDHRLAIMDAIQWGRPFCIDAWERYGVRRKMPAIPDDYVRFRNLMYPAGCPPFTGEWIEFEKIRPQAGMRVIVGAWCRGEWRQAHAMWYCRGLKPCFNTTRVFGVQVEWVPEIQQHCLLEGWYEDVATAWVRNWEPTHWQMTAAPPLPNGQEVPKIAE